MIRLPEEGLGQRLWQAARAARCVDDGDDDLGGDQQRVAAQDLLVQHHLRATGLFRGRLDGQNIVHPGRGLEVYFHAVHHKHQTFAIHLVQRALLDAEAAQIVRAGAFHEMEVARVIDKAGKVVSS